MKSLFLCAWLFPALLLTPVISAPAATDTASVATEIYAPENLLAWCIVPFDAKHRGPEERAQMLETLGIQRLAYDWRAEHIPTFEAEVEAMQKHHIEFFAWWFPGSLDADAETILAVIAKHKITPQLWVTGGGEMLQPGKANDARVVAEAARIKPLAEAAGKLGCQVALYNHGGWFGEPENQLDVISRLESEGVKNVGIVYNFHHGHDHLPRFGELVRKMKPHLLAVNLNGMVRQGDKANAKILALGTGDQELEMLRVLQASGWQGAVGIIDHRPETDSELTLRENLRGLKWLRAELDKPGSGGTKPLSAVPASTKYVEGKIGNALDAGTGGGRVLPGQAAYRQRPLIISAWAKLRNANAFNILIASDAKNSAEHWELYAYAKKGEFCVFQPGRGGNFASGVNITDDQWHQVSAVLEESRVRLYVDGKLAKELPAQPLQGKPQPGGFAIGQLVEGGIGCDGLIDDVHVWQGHDPAANNQEIGAWPLETAPPSAPAPAAFFPDALPLRPTEHPHHKERVNRDRMYDFYAKQALNFGPMIAKPEIIPSFPGLDSGRYGHWGNQNEEVWRDTSWNDMDAGGMQSGIISMGGKNVPRGVCVQLGAQRELAACFNTETLTWEGVWRGGRLLHFDSFRWGMLAALAPDGKLETKPESEPAAKGSFTYHGFYRHGGKVIFAFAKDGQEWLETAWSEQGKFQRQRELATGPLAALTTGGPAQWPQGLETKGTVGLGQPYAVDSLTFPQSPWKSLWHVGGHDFLPNGDAVLCTFEGEVWVVSGIDQTLEKLRWRRFASGLSQPLGLKVVDGKIYLLGRDQLTRLHDLNQDGEADFYEAFSRAYETPVGGHDYLTGLELDAQGRFYFASGKLGINRIAADGKSTETLATGFRNPNGLAVGPKGEVMAGVQEGDWTAASWLTELTPGGHYRHGGPRPGPLGNLPPTLFFPRGVENSCGGQVFVDSPNFGLPQGSLLHLSWGYGTAFMILRETIDGQVQGAAMPLPVEFRSGAHRGRFRQQDGQLYVSGMTGWGTYTPDAGSFQRLRYTGAPVLALKAFQAHDNGVRLEFSAPLAAPTADVKLYFAQQWNYLIGPAYGSDEYSVRWPQQPGHDVLEVRSVQLLDNGKSLFLEIPQLQPSHQLHLHVALPQVVSQDFYLTLHKLGPAFTTFPGYQVIAKTVTGQSAGLALEVAPSPFEQGAAGRALMIQTAAGLQFAQRELRAKAGERISLTLENGDLMPHNWVLGKRGTLEKISDDADRNLTNPKALSQSYVPQIPEVLASTRLANPNTKTTIHFTLPAEKGDYPYLCTFPGHTKIMRGVLHVD